MAEGHKGHAREAVEALSEATAIMPHAASNYLLVAQVHATLAVAEQLEILRKEGLTTRKPSLFDDMHYGDEPGPGRIPHSGRRQDCGICNPSAD